ncbi:MAG: PorT family protein [Chitinophagales bacterium]|nr:PorT family protein [Chitinophagales bacterium]
MSHNSENKSFDDFFKHRLENSSLQPPDDIWEKIDKKLPHKLPFYLRFKYPIAAALITFTLISSLFIYDKYSEAYQEHKKISLKSSPNSTKISSNIQYSNIDLNQATASLQNIDIEENTTTFQSNENELSNHQNFKKNDIIKLDAKGNSRKSSKNKASNFNTSDKNLFAGKEKKSIRKNSKLQLNNLANEHSVDNNLPSSDINQIVQNERLNEDLANLESLPTTLYVDDEESLSSHLQQSNSRKKKSSKYNRKGIIVAPILGGHFTAMTKSSREGVNTSQMEQSASFGKSYGLNVGYIINSRWSVGVEWLYNSDEGQHFSEVKNGQKQDKYLLLDYMKFPIYAKYTHKILTRYDKMPIAMSYIGGAHFSKLKTVNTYIDGEIAPFEVNYNQSQWGLLGGLEFDIYASRNIHFTLGTRVSFNADLKQFPKLRGDDKISPFSVQSGIYTKLNYVFAHQKVEKIEPSNEF